MKVCELLAFLDRIAPFSSAEDFDNPGLLIGSPKTEVSGILVGMDITSPLLEQAIRGKKNVIVTHHPFLFHAMKRIDTDSPQGQHLKTILENDLTVIAMHTNWDKAEGGISDTLASLFELKDIHRADDYLRVGFLPDPLSAEELQRKAEQLLHVQTHLYGEASHLIHSLAVAGGAYGEAASFAGDAGADALIVGEVRHHEILDGTSRGLMILCAEHFATEFPGVKELYSRILDSFPELSVTLHTLSPFGGAVQ